MEKGDYVEFNTSKKFKFIRTIGQGGSGDTHLFEDETTGILFAIKKYVPKGMNDNEENYLRFVDEIKILFKISNPNIVRIYNYYLYPEFKIGYLQMEYITGTTIDKFEEFENGKSWNDIFLETITSFEYLENKNILHRDIRPSNILIDDYSKVKIIDFGFGKNINDAKQYKNSVILNWDVTEMPEDIYNETYDHQTEIFFLGKLFQKLPINQKQSFRYNHILDKMTSNDRKSRYKSFENITKDISSGIVAELNFNKQEKNIYQNFADELIKIISYFNNSMGMKHEINDIISGLESIMRNNALEKYIQSNRELIDCFVTTSYSYYSSPSIMYDSLEAFYNLLLKFNDTKKKILIDNIYSRLSNIKINYDINDDDVPF